LFRCWILYVGRYDPRNIFSYRGFVSLDGRSHGVNAVSRNYFREILFQVVQWLAKIFVIILVVMKFFFSYWANLLEILQESPHYIPHNSDNPVLYSNLTFNVTFLGCDVVSFCGYVMIFGGKFCLLLRRRRQIRPPKRWSIHKSAHDVTLQGREVLTFKSCVNITFKT
jgi:hypothetical protein